MRWSLVALLAFLCAACGYTMGGGLAEQGVRTVAVRMARNQTYRQGIEEPLTEEVLRQLVNAQLLPASESSADAILEIELTSDRGRSLVSGGRQDPVREGALEFEVHTRILDRRTGRTLVDRHLIDRAEYRNPIGQNLDTATEELVFDLARKIVLALEAPF